MTTNTTRAVPRNTRIFYGMAAIIERSKNTIFNIFPVFYFTQA